MQSTVQQDTQALYFPDRLAGTLSDMLRYPLTIVEAPMGYGKTTYVREYLERTDAGQVLWQKVLDDSLYGFWKGFCRLLDRVAPAAAADLDALGFPTDSVTRHTALQMLETIRFAEETVLVVDDYHMIATAEANEWITFAVQNQIPKFHMILIARHTGLMDREELSLKRLLLHIGKDAFAFRADDIRRYYELCGVRLKKAEAEILYRQTEGWVSALYLMLLERQERGEASRQTDIDRLIEQAIYRHLSDEMKNLLLSLCLFEGFSAEQAAFVSDNPRAGALLDVLVDRRAFVRFDAGNGIYLIHNLFTNFLQDQLDRTALKAAVLSRIARWHAASGNFGLAQHFYYACGDFDGLYSTFEQERHTGVNYPYNREMLIKAFTEAPEAIRRQHLMGLLVLAFELYTYHEMNHFQEACQSFVAYIEVNHELSDDQRNHLLGEYELLMSFTQYNDINRMSHHHMRACSLLKTRSFLLPKRGIWTFGSPSILYMFHREAGSLSEAVETLFKALPQYSCATDGNAQGGEYCMRAEYALFTGDYSSALIDSYQALQTAEAGQQLSNVLCALFVQVRVAAMTGDRNLAVSLMDNMHQRISTAKEYLYLHTVEICEAWLYGLLGDVKKMSGWLSEGNYSSDKLLFPNYAMLNIVYGRAMVLREEWHKIIGNREAFLGVAGVFPNLLGQIYTWIYCAVAYRHLLRDKEAEQAMKTALDLALPDRLYLPFAENGDVIGPLLELLRDQAAYKAAIQQILSMHAGTSRSEGNGGRTTAWSILTDREREIAGLAADGYTNREIGSRLYITENTVKTQLKRVFEKLEITSRAKLGRALQEIE